METLVRRLGRIFSRTRNKPSEPARRLTSGMVRLEEALKVYVDKKGWREAVRTVGDAAERLGTDTRTLHRYFQERVGMDFRTWRTRLRLEDAMRLLADNPALPPAAAARISGFSNRSNFSRQFLAYTGLTPAQWRDSRAWFDKLTNRPGMTRRVSGSTSSPPAGE